MAIKWLKWIKNCFLAGSEPEEAIDFAIHSLETDEKYNLLYEMHEFIEDCVSRKAVNKMLADIEEAVFMGEGYDYNRWRDKVEDMESSYPKMEVDDFIKYAKEKYGLTVVLKELNEG